MKVFSKKTLSLIGAIALAFVTGAGVAGLFSSEQRWEIGTIDTAFKLIGPNHKIVVEGFKDPDFPSIVCYVSYAKAGGVTGALGLAENPARFSIDIERINTTPIVPTNSQKKQRQVFDSRSAFFRNMKIIRFYDDVTNALVYVASSTVLFDGSPFNAIAAVPLN